MVSDKQIEQHARKMGYDGKITPYIRKRVLGDLSETEELGEVSKTIKVTPKKKLSKIGKRVGRGVKRTAIYLSICGDRYKKYCGDNKTTSKKKPKGKRTKKSKQKRKSLNSIRKSQKDIDNDIMDWM